MTGGKRNLRFAKERFLPSASSGQAVASLCRNDSCDPNPVTTGVGKASSHSRQRFPCNGYLSLWNGLSRLPARRPPPGFGRPGWAEYHTALQIRVASIHLLEKTSCGPKTDRTNCGDFSYKKKKKKKKKKKGAYNVCSVGVKEDEKSPQFVLSVFGPHEVFSRRWMEATRICRAVWYSAQPGRPNPGGGLRAGKAT